MDKETNNQTQGTYSIHIHASMRVIKDDGTETDLSLDNQFAPILAATFGTMEEIEEFWNTLAETKF